MKVTLFLRRKLLKSTSISNIRSAQPGRRGESRATPKSCTVGNDMCENIIYSLCIRITIMIAIIANSQIDKSWHPGCFSVFEGTPYMWYNGALPMDQLDQEPSKHVQLAMMGPYQLSSWPYCQLLPPVLNSCNPIFAGLFVHIASVVHICLTLPQSNMVY